VLGLLALVSYHTTYCAAIALMDYRYLTECPRPVPPVPSIFKVCVGAACVDEIQRERISAACLL
jgi:hypothetical protein